MSEIDQLLNVMQDLRNPETGCAWDREQTFASIAPYTIEEAYEVADAIERHNLQELKEELGDLLLQVVFHAQMASEQGAFNFNDVAQSIVDKMIRRHPHVFGTQKNQDPKQLKIAWESQKAQERAAKAGTQTQTSAMDDVALSLPALMRAEKVQKRAARVGFDWPNAEPIWDKLVEESAEVREAIAANDQSAVEDELGDLLFTVVNLARHQKVDPEVALRKANKKFEKRFRLVESLAAHKGQVLEQMEVNELDELWERAKVELHAKQTK